MIDIGIIGNGFVGNAVAKGFGSFDIPIRIYDKDEKKSHNTFSEASKCSYVFVCLPTPMVSDTGGECNLSIIEEFFREVSGTAPKGPNRIGDNYTATTDDVVLTDHSTIFIIKSTVPVGTTERLSKEYPSLNIVNNPEFLTAANSQEDFMNSDRTVIGGERHLVNAVAGIYEECFPHIPIYEMGSNESELVKYISNCFLATKVTFFNEMYKLSEKLSMEWKDVVDAVSADSRIHASHTDVPGPDGDYGFGGYCFPKDINSLIDVMNKCDIPSDLLQTVWDLNLQTRTNMDWADNPSSVLVNEK